MLADSRGEAFRNCFLGGPAGGVVLVGILQAVAVGALLVREHALEEPIAVFLEHLLDALGLDEIATKANQDAARGKSDHEVGTTEYTEHTERKPKPETVIL